MGDVRRMGRGVFYVADCLAASKQMWTIFLAVSGVRGDQGARDKAEFGGLAAQSVDVIASETLVALRVWNGLNNRIDNGRGGEGRGGGSLRRRRTGR